MTGSRRRLGLGTWVLTSVLGLSATARAQDPAIPPTPVPAPATAPAPDAGPILDPAPPLPADMGTAGMFAQAGEPRARMSLLGAAMDSLFGDVYAEGRWRPLSFATFFSEGWDEGWASGPAGREGLTPRHGWLGSFDGVFYRLWFTVFSENRRLSAPYKGNAYGGDYAIFLPLSRRFEVAMDIPFIRSNGTVAANKGYTTQYGDMQVIPRVLLSETAATSQTFAMLIRTPTGTRATGNGVMSLTPRYEFWTNPGGAWVVRGSAGATVPLNTSTVPGQTAFTGGLDIGRYFTPHDALLGDLVFYAATNWSIPLEGSASASYFSIGPGTRFHLWNNNYFLGFCEIPLTGPLPYSYTMQFSILTVF